MRRAAMLAILTTCGLALAAGLPQLDNLDGTIAGREFKSYIAGPNPTFTISGDVVIDATRLGASPAQVHVTGERATFVLGENEQGKLALAKLFATGKIHVEGEVTDAIKGTTQIFNLDCERIEYRASDETLHCYPAPGGLVTGFYHYRQVPTPANQRTEPSEYRLNIKATDTVDVFLAGEPVELAGPEPQ